MSDVSAGREVREPDAVGGTYEQALATEVRHGLARVGVVRVAGGSD
jgi:hypothetical protein